MKEELGYQIVNMLKAIQLKQPGTGSAKHRSTSQQEQKSAKLTQIYLTI